MHPINLVTVFLENKPGRVAFVTRLLADAAVNICWVTIAGNDGFGVMKFLVDRQDQAVETLKREGLMVSLLDVLAVEVANRPGGLQAVADALGREGLNLDNCSGFVANERAILLIEVKEPERAKAVLARAGLKLLSQEAMLKC